ncbi:MAG: hypothetical protein JXR45_01385, partial [Deltaproteobacteria bacterium]|nr:hypothetical protein [Deltaproteobacteria bacterium]
MSANLFAKYISALFAVALLTGCKEPECDSSMDCTGGAMCVSGVCRETAAGSTDADNPIDPVTPVHTNNNDTATDDTDSHTDSEPMPTSDTGAEIIHLDSDSDTTIDPDADLGCRHDYTDYAT